MQPAASTLTTPDGWSKPTAELFQLHQDGRLLAALTVQPGSQYLLTFYDQDGQSYTPENSISGLIRAQEYAEVFSFYQEPAHIVKIWTGADGFIKVDLTEPDPQLTHPANPIFKEVEKQFNAWLMFAQPEQQRYYTDVKEELNGSYADKCGAIADAIDGIFTLMIEEKKKQFTAQDYAAFDFDAFFQA